MMKFNHKFVIGSRSNSCQFCLLFVDLDQIVIVTIIYKWITQRKPSQRIEKARENIAFKHSKKNLMKTFADVKSIKRNSILYVFDFGNQKNRKMA